MSAGRTPTLLEVVSAIIEKRLGDLHTALPGIVQTYYPATQTADILPAVKTPLPDGTFESWPVLPHVPIAWPRGGGYVFSFPLAKGDSVQVIFNEQELTQFRLSGGESEPLDLRKYDGSFATAYPCAMTDPAVSTDPDVVAGTALVIGKESGPKILVDGTVIKLAREATDYVALASKVDACMTVLNILATWTVVPADGGAALKAAIAAALTTAFGATTFPSVAATVVKAK